jgi:hypothetical protein
MSDLTTRLIELVDGVHLASEYDDVIAKEPGTAALFIPGKAEGAIPNGTRIVKCNTQTRDSFFDGDAGTVKASHLSDGLPGIPPSPFFYFVEFDKKPGLPVAIFGNRITTGI